MQVRQVQTIPEGMTTTAPLVVILLATHNGIDWLDEQLASIEGQTHSRIDVLVSDDMSTDGTVERLRYWARRWRKGRFYVRTAMTGAAAENFRSLLVNCELIAEFYAFADQDDIWLPGKLAVGIRALEHATEPALYGGATLILRDGAIEGTSPHFHRPPDFRNALVQSIAGGNTMMFNRRAFEALQKAAARTGFVSHDWFAYMIVSGIGGEVVYDPTPQLLYRQHGRNVQGANTGWKARLGRLMLAISGRFATWNDINLEGLRECREMLSFPAQRALDEFSRARRGSLIGRIQQLRRSGVFRQTRFGQLSLFAACVLRKM